MEQWKIIIIELIILISGVLFSIWKAKSIARVTAKETAMAEFEKIKSEKWWNIKLDKYEFLMKSLDEHSRSIHGFINKMSTEYPTIHDLDILEKEIYDTSSKIDEIIYLGRFYFNEEITKKLEEHTQKVKQIFKDNENREVKFKKYPATSRKSRSS